MTRFKKAITFSYDDGTTQDKRLISILDKYGLKCTFNLNSGLLGTGGGLVREGVTVAHVKWRSEEVAKIYKNHEIAAHTVHHPALSHLEDEDVVREVEEDRLALSELAGYEVIGMAYPGSSAVADERVQRLVRERTGIRYVRNTTDTDSFAPQTDLINFCPTIHHHNRWADLFRLADEFLALDETTLEEPQVFYIWGHSFEFDIYDDWDVFELFCKHIARREDVFYGTNRQVLLGID